MWANGGVHVVGQLAVISARHLVGVNALNGAVDVAMNGVHALAQSFVDGPLLTLVQFQAGCGQVVVVMRLCLDLGHGGNKQQWNRQGGGVCQGA